ncbi:TetR/AcrR family transcriptional regulator [Prescottella equi]|uniref:TetR/AcrR family transcriptional regulator n=1 Tax=Rhodococcus hoagii TaxID=43767 RepID=UPI000A95809D|nr:TetR/AcrR family transcriptional regulator [Prescottella equi]
MARTDDWLAGGNRREVAVARITAAATDLFLERGFDRVGFWTSPSARDVHGRRCTGTWAVSPRSSQPWCPRPQRRSPRTWRARWLTSTVPIEWSRRSSRPWRRCGRTRRSRTGSHNRTGAANGYLASSPDLARFATTLTGAVADDLAGEWIVRVVLTLLAWPGADGDTERHMVRHFVAPAFAT